MAVLSGTATAISPGLLATCYPQQEAKTLNEGISDGAKHLFGYSTTRLDAGRGAMCGRTADM
jgi:hypothetical protein